MSDDMIGKLVPAVDTFFDELGDVSKGMHGKVQMAMWALLDDLGIDLDEFVREYEKYHKAKQRRR